MGATAAQRVFPGILRAADCALLKGNPRVLVLSHAAAVTPGGATTVDWLREQGYGTVVGAMGPEHGFLGHAAAGTPCRTFRHPLWQVPVYSLYGSRREPRPAWLRRCDVLLIDLQDLGYRPYTYLATLYLALRAAARQGVPVVVADRPIPLPRLVEGPVLDPAFTSFVGPLPVPLCHGMTPGETARWIRQQYLPDLMLEVLPLRGFRRAQSGMTGVHPWISPSPAIRSPETAIVYPATVGLEAFGQIDHGRHTTMPFQVIGASWLEPHVLRDLLQDCTLPGVQLHAHVYVPQPGAKPLVGLRVTVTHPQQLRPAAFIVQLLHILTQRYGVRRIWRHRLARPEFFDKLMGTDRVRTALLAGVPPAEIAGTWNVAAFRRQRSDALLYR